MLNIWKEIQEVKNGEADKDDNVLINAPHPEYEIVSFPLYLGFYTGG